MSRSSSLIRATLASGALTFIALLPNLVRDYAACTGSSEDAWLSMFQVARSGVPGIETGGIQRFSLLQERDKNTEKYRRYCSLAREIWEDDLVAEDRHEHYPVKANRAFVGLVFSQAINFQRKIRDGLGGEPELSRSLTQAAVF